LLTTFSKSMNCGKKNTTKLAGACALTKWISEKPILTHAYLPDSIKT